MLLSKQNFYVIAILFSRIYIIEQQKKKEKKERKSYILYKYRFAEI